MTGQLIINSKDAFTTWGVFMEEGALSAILAPPPLKPFPENKSRLEHGKQVLTTSPKIDERTLQLPLAMKAATHSALITAQAGFLAELHLGALTVTSSLIPNTTFHFVFESCQQYSSYNTMAKYVLRLSEPNPNNR